MHLYQQKLQVCGTMFLNFLWVGIGGSIGAMLRYGVYLFSTSLLGDAWPWGTLLANLFGCFAMGVVLGMGLHKEVELPYLLFAVGVLGALTTFSTFSAETLELALQGRPLTATFNVLGNVIGCLVSCYAGLLIAKYWAGTESLVA